MLFDFLSLIFSAILGGLISLGLYKISERKEKEKKRIEEFHELIVKTKEIPFEATDLLSDIKQLNKDTITKCRNLTGNKIPDYTLSILSHAIYTDENIYNKTIEFIDLLRDQINELGDGKIKPNEFIEIVNSVLDTVSKEGFVLLNFFEKEYQKYLIEFGNKYMDK